MPVLLSSRYLFPEINSGEDAKRHGLTAPPFDPTKPVKRWFDPAPPEDEDGNVTYDFVLAIDPKTNRVAEVDGRPYARKMTISAAEARTLNVLQADTSQSKPGTKSRPAPFTFDPETEILDYSDSIPGFAKGSIVVRGISETVEPTFPAATFTTEDHRLLVAIAKKVGVGAGAE